MWGDDFSDFFPELPSYYGQWAPIYFEPILDSGERITIAIAILDMNGSFKIFKTLNSEVLDSLYGVKSHQVMNIINWCKSSLESHINSAKSLTNWKPPINGLFMGEIRDGCDNNINMLARQAIQFTSSLSSLAMAAEHEHHDSKANSKQVERWHDLIVRDSLILDPRMEPYFKVKVEIGNSSVKTQFGFFSESLAMNFGVISPVRVMASLNNIKARILDLEYLSNSNLILIPEDFGMILKVPSGDRVDIDIKSKQKIEDIIESIHEIGDKSAVNIYTADNSIDAAKKLIELAA